MMMDIEERPRRMLKIEGVLEIVPLSRATLYRMMEKKQFPRSIPVSTQVRLWFEDEIIAWQKQWDRNARPHRRSTHPGVTQSGA